MADTLKANGPDTKTVEHDEPVVLDSTMPFPRVIAFEGNIGVGKSTVINRLQKLFEDHPRVVVLPEPVEEWRERGFLQDMYNGAISKGEFQHMVLQSLTGQLLAAMMRTPTPALIIMERSPWGALYTCIHQACARSHA